MGEQRYLVIKNDDIQDLLTPNYRKILGYIVRRIANKRQQLDKPPVNNYLVVNTDEAFIGQMYDVMAANGITIIR